MTNEHNHEAKAAPAVPDPADIDRQQLREACARFVDENRKASIAAHEAKAAPAVPDVMSILRAIHRRPSDAGIWLDDITRILRDAPEPAVPQGWKSVLIPTEWTIGPNLFKDWCSQWFGPDSDDEYLMHAAHALLGLAAAPAPAVPSVLKRGYGRLIQAAADLALQQFMPSDIVDDYPSKTISAAKVAKMMTQPRDRLRLLSIEVSEGAKQMIAAAPAAPSQEPVTLTDEAVNAAAKVLAERFDYPWEHMPEEGRKNMRVQARAVVIAALREKGGA